MSRDGNKAISSCSVTVMEHLPYSFTKILFKYGSVLRNYQPGGYVYDVKKEI